MGKSRKTAMSVRMKQLRMLRGKKQKENGAPAGAPAHSSPSHPTALTLPVPSEEQQASTWPSHATASLPGPSEEQRASTLPSYDTHTPVQSEGQCMSTSQVPSTPQSSSLTTHSKRLIILKDIVPPPEQEASRKYVVSGTQLQAIVEQLQCSVRGCHGSVSVIPTSNKWDTTIVVVCNDCETKLCHSRPKTLGSYSEANLLQVYFSLVTGVGRAGLQKAAGFFSSKNFNASAYSTHCNFLFKKMDSYYEDLMKKARERVRTFYMTEHLRAPDDQGNVSIDVSFDGTWMTRGHKSHIGMCFVIDVHTGIIVDMEVLCNFCPACKGEKVQTEHACHMNFNGKSGAMETEGAVRLWSRSTEHNLKYETFIGDGDSSAYKAVCKLNDGRGPYDVAVIKEECINHVSKRIGARLRKKRSTSFQGGEDKLTDAHIDQLSKYFGITIRENVGSSYETMKKALWATYFHLSSTDEHPSHHFCPPGVKSWCFYNKAKALDEKPESHTFKNLFLSRISPIALQHVREVFEELTAPDILGRCLRGVTQNQNESLHSKLWAKTSKTKYVGLFRVAFVAKVTTLEHNFGGHANLMTHLFGTNPDIVKSLDSIEASTERAGSPRKRPVKRKLCSSREYEAGGF